MNVDADRLRRVVHPLAVPMLLFAATIVVRFVRLQAPRHLMFDEVFYASDALDLLENGVVSGRPDHPPLGKWLIAAGIEVFGFTPLGWRVAALVAGAALVVVVYQLALTLTSSSALGVLAAGLVVVDGLAFTMGRIAMLDGFLALFTTLAFGLALLAVHRERVHRGELLVAAAALGCALAVKWSALPVAALVLVMFLFVDFRHGRAGWRSRLVNAATVIAVPAAIYFAVHIPWLVNIDETQAAAEVCVDRDDCSPAVVTRVDAWVSQQFDVLEFHRELQPTSWQAEPGWTWITFPTPPVFLRKRCIPAMALVPEELSDGMCPSDTQTTKEVRVEGVGSPVLWGGAAVAGLALVWRTVRHRDPTALFLLAAALAIWGPWLVTTREAFTFYATPLVPILAWWLVTALSYQSPRVVRIAAPIVGAAALVAFVWYYPVLVGLPLDPGDPRFVSPFWS